MSVKGDYPVSFAHPADNISKAVDLHLVKAELFHLILYTFDYFLLLAALTRMRNHITKKTAHFRPVFLCCINDL